MLLFEVDGSFSNEMTLIELLLLVLVRMKVSSMKVIYNFSHEREKIVLFPRCSCLMDRISVARLYKL